MDIPLIPTQVTTKYGDVVRVNDHVYISQWKAGTPTPWHIGRIMEFLPYSRVRIQNYYRPQDMNDRVATDPRVLYAAISSDICEVGQLRAKCYVVHRDSITDLAGWKKHPDRFIFTKFFDHYIKRDFEIIRTADIRNLPDNILRTLKSRYEYVVTERDFRPKLTCDFCTCANCSQWASPRESISCDICETYYHLRCVNPPLPARPTRGYVWNCGPCSLAHEEAVERRVQPAAKSRAPPTSVRQRGRPRKDRGIAEREDVPLPVKHFNLWSIRYFGHNTVPEDTLDPNDYIYPRQTVRASLNGKYSAAIPELGSERPSDIEERGNDETIEVLSCVNSMSEEKVAEFEKCKTMLPNYDKLSTNIDWLTEATYRLCAKHQSNEPIESASMTDPFRVRKWKKEATKYMDRVWSSDEKEKFETSIGRRGPELRAVRDDVGTRDIYEVVRFYGHWKNEKLGEVNNDLAHGKREFDSDSDSVYTPSKANTVCSICKTHDSTVWYKSPVKQFGRGALCENCGIHWRKYADLSSLRPQREESTPTKGKSTSAGEKRERESTPALPPAKKQKTSASGSRATVTPPPIAAITAATAMPASQVRCSVCHKNGPAGKVLRCKRCGTKMHAGACGVIPEAGVADNWKCDLCVNEEQSDACMNTDCVLCPSPKHIREREKERDKRTGKEKERDPNDTFLRACKPTEGQGWSHVLCAVFVPGVVFSDASRLGLVEGIASVTRDKWEQLCVLCKQKGGAVLKCEDCDDRYHASCAWNKNYKFGFEMHPVRAAQRNSQTTVNFKDHAGTMRAVVRCRRHEGPYVRPPFFDICEANEFGETALQVYCRNYKQAAVAQSHGLLRKAHRLDAILDTPRREREREREGPCMSCRTIFTPKWHESARGRFCHACWITHESHRGANGAGHTLLPPLANGARARAALVAS